MLTADGKVRLVDVKSLRPHDQNRRSITEEMFLKLRKSIREDPELLRARPVLALPDGRIIGGRFRWEAAKAEEWSRVPVFAIDVDEDRALTIMLRDNNPYGQNDDDVVGEILHGLNERGVDLDLAGLPAGDVRSILREVAKGNPADVTCDDELPPVPKRARSKRGTVYELGRHRIMVGDSTKSADVAKLMDGASADLLFTSPPYNVDVDYGTHDDASVDWSKYGAFLRAALKAWYPVIGDGRAVCWNVGVAPRTYHARQLLLLEEMGFAFTRQYIWHKVGVPVPTWHFTANAMRARHLTSNYVHELVLMHVKGGKFDKGPALDDLDELLEHDVFSLHQAASTRDVADGDKKSGVAGSNLDRRARKAHPAVFPVRLPAMFAQHLTAPGEIIVDPFVGAGTTIIAAEKLGRTCYAMELDAAYVDVARDRFETYVGESKAA